MNKKTKPQRICAVKDIILTDISFVLRESVVDYCYSLIRVVLQVRNKLALISFLNEVILPFHEEKKLFSKQLSK